MNPDSLDLLEELIARLEQDGGKVTGASVIRFYSNRVLQWRAVVVLNHGMTGRELNGYGSTGRDAIAAVTREAESLLKQWASARSRSPTGA